MAIRFSEADARPMGRNTSGVKGIKLSQGRLRSSAWSSPTPTPRCSPPARTATASARRSARTPPVADGELAGRRRQARPRQPPAASRAAPTKTSEAEGSSSSFRYRTQRRGGKGLRDIKTTDRNGPVIGIVRVDDDDELLMMTARGKIQRDQGQRHQRHRPQHAGRAHHAPRRRRHARRHRPRAQGRTRRRRRDGGGCARSVIRTLAPSATTDHRPR